MSRELTELSKTRVKEGTQRDGQEMRPLQPSLSERKDRNEGHYKAIQNDSEMQRREPIMFLRAFFHKCATLLGVKGAVRKYSGFFKCYFIAKDILGVGVVLVPFSLIRLPRTQMSSGMGS